MPFLKMNTTKQLKKLNYIIFIFIFFSFSKSGFIDINLEEEDFSERYKNQNEVLSFRIKGNSSPYIKIKVEGKDDIVNNHIISYYQEEDLKERKQLSQSIKDTTIMWLNKAQIEKEFYITIECAKKSCSFKVNIDKKEKAELYLNEQYTYYVTEENQKMDFILKYSEIDYDQKLKYYVAVWVRGNYKIESKLSGQEKENDIKTYAYYRVEFDDDFKNSEYSLNIKGEIGDLVNVGVVFFRECVDNICQAQLKLENGEEVSGLLQYRVQHSFPLNKLGSNMLPLGLNYDFINANDKHISLKFDGFYYKYYIESKYKEEEIFYTIQHIYEMEYDGQGNNKYSPLVNGIYYTKKLYEGTTIGLIPMKPDNDFGFLTYEIISYDPLLKGNISVSIYECDNYPLCHINDEIIKKSKKIEDYKNYYYTFKKEEWGKDISLISKKQNMLLITCKDGLKMTDDLGVCEFKMSMKTDKKFVNYTDFNKENPPYNRFIRKNNEDKYFLKGASNQIELYIEIITGDINIEINGNKYDYKKYSKGNKYFFVIPKNKDAYIIIKAKENSLYSINGNYNKKAKLTVDYNYLISIDDNRQVCFTDEIEKEESGEEIVLPESPLKNGENLKYENKDNKIHDKENYNVNIDEDALQHYIRFNPLNCDINIKFYLKEEKREVKGIKKGKFYQEIIPFYYNNTFEISKINNDNPSESCLCYISAFYKNNINLYGIKLLNNTLQEISFKKGINLIQFSFPHTNLENDIKIKFELLNDEEYEAKVRINGENVKNVNINSKNKNINLKADDIKKKCADFEYICNIFLDIERENNKKESNLTITLASLNEDGNIIDDEEEEDDDTDKNKDNSDEEHDTDKNKDNSDEDEDTDHDNKESETATHNDDDDDDEEDDDDDKDKLIIVLSIMGAVAIIIIIGVIFYITKIYNKNKDLNQAINQISFKYNDNDRDAMGCDLLE